jgi:SAM-dependent methyltransferase
MDGSTHWSPSVETATAPGTLILCGFCILKKLVPVQLRPWTDEGRLQTLLTLLNGQSQPNINALTQVLRNVEMTNLSLKSFGYDLAQRLAEVLPPPTTTGARHVGLSCKPSIQADLESDWARHWLAELKIPLVFHRKLWELAFVLQSIFEEGHLRPGASGLGFGCGTEPLPSYFMSHGIKVLITDLPADEAQDRGWADTGQHASSLEQAFHPGLVDRARFDELSSLAYVDMNAIPADLTGYDFCWSVCALEHLGTIEKGLAFVENSLATLKPGGLAVHTTEFNINPEGPTIDNWPSVLFQRKHFEALAERLTGQGHEIAPFDFHLGDKPMDRFIDLPPWGHDMPQALAEWMGHMAHMKVATDGFPATCFGLKIRKKGESPDEERNSLAVPG